jgi:hypothetical protein
MKILKSKLLFITGLIFSISINAQVLNSKYDTKNHPKAKGIWLTIRYPAGWEAKEGVRPNIVQKFSGEYKNIYTNLTLQIADAGGPIENECSTTSAKKMQEILSDPEANQFAMDTIKTKHENKPAFIYDAKTKIERAGMSYTTSHRVMTVCYKNTMISAWCSPVKIDYSNKQFDSNKNDLKEIAPLCFQFFNSLVLMDSYKNN